MIDNICFEYLDARIIGPVAKELEETDDFIWLTYNEVLEHIKSGDILDGRVMAMIFKYFLHLSNFVEK